MSFEFKISLFIGLELQCKRDERWLCLYQRVTLFSIVIKMSLKTPTADGLNLKFRQHY